MNPIRYAGIIAFIDWINRNQPEVRSLKATTEREFLRLATQFEASKGLMIDPNHEVYMKWRSTYWRFSDANSDQEALDRLR